MAKSVIVTGAGGFIGRQAIAPLLKEGFQVHLVSRLPQSLDLLDSAVRSQCREHYVDLLDSQATAVCLQTTQASHLVHLAWYGGTGSRWSNLANLDWSAATIKLVKTFAEQGGKYIVVGGSCAEYSWQTEVLREDVTPLAPHTLYGAAKAYAHQLLATASNELDISLTWAHIFFCYGPGEAPGRLVHDVVSALLQGKPVDCTSGTQIRDYLYTVDIGRILAKLAVACFNGSVNVGSGVGIPVKDVILAVANELQRPDLIRFGAKPLNAGEHPRLVANNRRLRELVDLDKFHSIAEGVSKTVAWYRRHL